MQPRVRQTCRSCSSADMTHRMSVSVAAAFVKKSSLHAIEYMCYISDFSAVSGRTTDHCTKQVHASIVTQPLVHHNTHLSFVLVLFSSSCSVVAFCTLSREASRSACTVLGWVNVPEKRAACSVCAAMMSVQMACESVQWLALRSQYQTAHRIKRSSIGACLLGGHLHAHLLHICSHAGILGLLSPGGGRQPLQFGLDLPVGLRIHPR